jgi:hypothetical protein
MLSLIIILALSGAVIYLAYRVWYLAGIIADSQDLDVSNIEYIEGLELTNQYMYDKIVESYNKMQEIDRLGAFEKDDESGTTFQLLNEVITQLKSEFEDGTQENQ